MEIDQKLQVGIKRRLYNASMRKVRIQLGMSQKELSEACGMSIVKIGEFESLKRVPTPDEAGRIADMLEVSVEDIFPMDLYQRVVDKVKGIKSEVFFDITPLTLKSSESLLLSNGEDIESIDRNEGSKMLVDKYIDQLQTREKAVLSLRFGMQDGVTRTLEDVAKEFGVTRERVRQIEDRGLHRLKNLMKVDGVNMSNFI